MTTKPRLSPIPCKSFRTCAIHTCEATRANLAPGYASVTTGPSEREDHQSHVCPVQIHTHIILDQQHYDPTNKVDVTVTVTMLTSSKFVRPELKSVEVSRPDRAKKGTIEVKVMLDNADDLMRKVWHQLEVPCREEGVKRYMVEASSQMSPAKEKQKTAIQKARCRVVEHLREEAEKRMKKVEEQKKTNKKQAINENVVVDLSAVMPPGEGVDTVAGIQLSQEDGEKLSAGATEQSQEETETQELPDLEQEDSVEMIGVETVGTKEPENLQGNQKVQEGDALHQELTETQKKGSDKTGSQPLPADSLDTVRVRGQKWTPPLGKRRCSGNCPGCQKKCKELNLPDCQSCYLNKVRMNNNNGCCNRGPCTNMRNGKVKKDKNGDEVMSVGHAAELSNVDNIISDFENKGLEKDHKELEEDQKNSKKRTREKGSTPEAQQKTSQIARLSVTGALSKQSALGKPPLLSK